MGDTLHRATISVETGPAQTAIQRLASLVEQMAGTLTALARKLGADLAGVATQALQSTTQAASQSAQRIQSHGQQAFEGLSQSAGAGATRVQQSLDTLTLSAILDQIERVGRGLNSLAGAGMNFEQSIADLAAITGSAGDELKELEQTARQVGKSSGLGAAESARAFTILASQIQVPVDELKVLQEQTVLLSQAGGLSLEASANALAGTINQFKLSSDQAARVANVLAAGSRAGAAEIDDLAESFKVVGSAAGAMGVSVEETAASIEILSKSNIKGAEAGTGLRNVLVALTQSEINVGEEGISGALKRVKAALDDIEDPVARNSKIIEVFGRQNLATVSSLLGSIDALDEMTVAVMGTNEAQQQAEIRTNTAKQAVERLKAKVEEIKISINSALGESFLPMAAAFADQAVQVSLLLPLVGVLRKGILGLVNAQKIAAVAQRALNFAMSANPIGILVMALAALVAGIVFAYKNCEAFRNGVDKVWGVVKALALLLWEKLKPAFNAIGEVIQAIWPFLKKLGGFIVDALLLPFKLLGKALEWVADKLRDWFGLNLSAGEGKLEDTLQKETTAAQNEAKSIEALNGKLKELKARREELLKQGESIKEVDQEIRDTKNGLIAKQEEEAARIAKSIDAVTQRLHALHVERERFLSQGSLLGGVEAKITVAERELESLQKAYDALKPKEERDIQKAHLGKGEERDDQKIRNLYSIEGLTNLINDLQEKAALSHEREAVAILKKAKALEKVKKEMETRIENAADESTHLARVDKIKARIASLQDTIQHASKEAGKRFSQELDKLYLELTALRRKIKAPITMPIILAKPIYKEEIEEVVKSAPKRRADHPVLKHLQGAPQALYKGVQAATDKAKREWDQYVNHIQSGAGAIASVMGNMGKIVGGSAGAWLQWGGQVVGAIAQAMPALLALFNAQTAVAGSGAASSKAAIPVVGPALAVAAVASVLAAVTAIPKATAFAAGGIVSGPTYALVGEYAGAQNNPEVIAPLNKLRELIRPAATDSRGLEANVEFKIRGRDLIGIIHRENQLNKLS